MSIEYRQSYPTPEPETRNLDAHSLKYLQKKVGRSAFLQSTLHIDTAVEQLHSSFPLDTSTDTFAADSLRLRAHLDQTEAQLNSEPPSMTDITDYFRLANVYDFALESAAVQAAFSSPEEVELRESIVDGLTGKSVARIEQALNLYDNTINPFKKRWLRGAISEQLALTLTNISENLDRIALPASLKDDLFKKTDLNIYHFIGDEGRVTPVQVKSGHDTDTPEQGINLNAERIGHYYDKFSGINPKQNFQLARILVKLMDGGELNDAEARALELSVNHFNNELERKLAFRPGFTV